MKIRILLLSIVSILMLPTLYAQQGALTHARAVVNVQENQPYFVTLKWAVPFADTKYTVSCSPLVSSDFQGVGQGVYLFQVTTITPKGLTVELAAIGTGNVKIDCLALHD